MDKQMMFYICTQVISVVAIVGGIRTEIKWLTRAHDALAERISKLEGKIR